MRQNLDPENEEDSAERQRLVLNASKELRAILADIAEEVGGRGRSGVDRDEPEAIALDVFEEKDLSLLIDHLRGNEIAKTRTQKDNNINERSRK